MIAVEGDFPLFILDDPHHPLFTVGKGERELLADPQFAISRLSEITGGELLLVPQFTLAADTKKGTRASFTRAAAPEKGDAYFRQLVAICRGRLGTVETGRFGADMQVALVNDGPVTFWLES